jgi:hypothetical protein
LNAISGSSGASLAAILKRTINDQIWLQGENKGLTGDAEVRDRAEIENDSSTHLPSLQKTKKNWLSGDHYNREKLANWYVHLHWMVGAR